MIPFCPVAHYAVTFSWPSGRSACLWGCALVWNYGLVYLVSNEIAVSFITEENTVQHS